MSPMCPYNEPSSGSAGLRRMDVSKRHFLSDFSHFFNGLFVTLKLICVVNGCLFCFTELNFFSFLQGDNHQVRKSQGGSEFNLSGLF